MNHTIFSGIKPTGHLSLGNYLGALGRFVRTQDDDADTTQLYSVVNLHALTVEHDPAQLQRLTQEAATLYLAAGLDPERSVLFRQGDVVGHTTLSYLLECTAYVGELSRMIQYKEKGRGRPMTRSSLFTYPVLMAADILVYGTTDVPVGDDQKQHVELARDLARRFNRTYGDVFVVPEMTEPVVAARVMDLQDPTSKMSKGGDDDALGVIHLLDSPDLVRRKVMRAVTDTVGAVRPDRENQPGVANLLDILGACTETSDLDKLAGGYSDYGALKRDVVDAVVAILEPLQQSYAELNRDPGAVDKILRLGAERAEELAAPYVTRAREALGLGGPVT